MKETIITGAISTIQKGAGFIDDIETSKESIYIEPGNLNCALNKDTVEVKVFEKTIRGVKQKVGEVTKVLVRARESFVGYVSKEGDVYKLIPDDRKMYVKIALSHEEVKRHLLKEGQKIQARLLPWSDPKVEPEGAVLQVLGMKGDNDVEMKSIVLEKGFDVGFPPEVVNEAGTIGESQKSSFEDEVKKRRDMRGILTFTIDPYDAKDFDDAISFRQLDKSEVEKYAGSGDLYEIGVHIADVSHYVTEGSQLDKEALKRGCSIYLVDRTIPMLPEVLSNDVCSLNPHEDKFSFSAIFVMDAKANIKERWFGKTIMNSTFRFTYETAQAVIDGDIENTVKYSKGIQKAEYAKKGMQFRGELVKLNEIAKILQKDKFSRGAIEFEQEEVKFRLDEKGKPVGVYVYERHDTHKLIEEYMLLANREVAKFIFDSIKKKGNRDTGAIYRIHEVPDKEKIKDLGIFVKALGYDLRAKDGTVTARDLNDLLDQIEGTPHESLVRTAAVRSMQKAIYSTKNIGHFGLAFEFYTHFTSPIRRYPDLLVHRVLSKHLHNEPFKDTDIITFQKVAETSTEREINAAQAERESKKLKQVEYMSERVGKSFEGIISGVTKWGIYVEEKESKSEGMIKIGELGNDYYVFNEKTYSIVGERTKKKFTLGDTIKFKVLGADVEKKVLDYAIA